MKKLIMIGAVLCSVWACSSSDPGCTCSGSDGGVCACTGGSCECGPCAAK
ncbi:hypothetical protein PQO01_00905 [Lentisphaera marina]|nr:hypothetical protein [Lentisphaera marina]MDD7983508.1 hypothetical protein [Lentisphaera marina]